MASLVKLGRSSNLVIPLGTGCGCFRVKVPLPTLTRGLKTSRLRLRDTAGKKEEAAIVGIPYSKLALGVPKEVFQNEKRVALTPATVAAMCKKGFMVNVEDGAGVSSKFRNSDYEASGAKIVDKKGAFGSDIVLKVRQPTVQEAGLFREEGTLYSFLYPAQNKDLIDALAKRKLTAFGMDCVPRISRAQVFDALSSMGNISGNSCSVTSSVTREPGSVNHSGA